MRENFATAGVVGALFVVISGKSSGGTGVAKNILETG
jgi:hypothetical protein